MMCSFNLSLVFQNFADLSAQINSTSDGLTLSDLGQLASILGPNSTILTAIDGIDSTVAVVKTVS